MVLIWLQITILFYCLGRYHLYPRKNGGCCSNYDNDFKLEAWVLIWFWLTNEKSSKWSCNSELLYSLFSAILDSFAAKTVVVKLQGLNPRDAVFKFFPTGSCFFFQKNSHRNGGSHLYPAALSSLCFFATLRESVLPGGLLTRLVYELIKLLYIL